MKNLGSLSVFVAVIGAAILVSPCLAVAQGSTDAVISRHSKGDTLTMSCAQARQLVGDPGGTLLYSGPNRYDLYHRAGASCYRLQQTIAAAYVPTRDNPQCFIGYTCVEIDDMGLPR